MWVGVDWKVGWEALLLYSIVSIYEFGDAVLGQERYRFRAQQEQPRYLLGIVFLLVNNFQ